MNTTTKAQRYNKKLDEIFETAKVLKAAEDAKRAFIGRNIGQENGLYCITWHTEDIVRYIDTRKCKKDYFSTYREASMYMTRLKNNGAHWFDAHGDPTI